MLGLEESNETESELYFLLGKRADFVFKHVLVLQHVTNQKQNPPIKFLKQTCTVSWFPDESIRLTSINMVDDHGVKWGDNFLATSEVESLRADIVSKQRRSELFTYFSHFILRNEKLPEDFDDLIMRPAYNGIYHYRCPFPQDIILSILSIMNQDPSKREEKLRDLAKRWFINWVELP